MSDEDCNFTCPQCPKVFATRSNLKRHMENPNIHNIPYARSRDQKRWKGHAKKVSSRAETTERMRKWRAENRDKNKRNDLRCRVYRLARQKFGEEDSEEKQRFINDEITRRLGRRMLLEEQQQQQQQHKEDEIKSEKDTQIEEKTLNELPFYCAPLHKIELPSININSRHPSNNNNTNNTTEPSEYNINSPSPKSDLEDSNSSNRRYSGCSSTNSVHSHRTSTTTSNSPPLIDMLHNNNTTTTTTTTNTTTNTNSNNSLPPMQSFLTSLQPPSPSNQLHKSF